MIEEITIDKGKWGMARLFIMLHIQEIKCVCDPLGPLNHQNYKKKINNQ